MYILFYLEVFGFQTSGYNLVYKETLYVIWGACVSCIFRYIRTFVVSKLTNITKNTRDVFAWCQYVMNTCLYWKSGMTKVFLCRMWFCNEAVIIIYLLQANIGDKNFRSTFFMSTLFHTSLAYYCLCTCCYLEQPKCQPNVWFCISTVYTMSHSLRLGSTSQSPYLHLMQLLFFMQTLFVKTFVKLAQILPH